MTQKNYTSIKNLIKKYQPLVSKPSQTWSKPKEVEPPLPKSEKIELRETVEYEPAKEVGSYIQPRKEIIELPPDLQKIGLQTTSSTKFPSYQTVALPISDDKILQGLHAPIYSSLRWLATLCLYLLRKAHLALKVVHGHVIRVIRR
jgi:hypothetical protein